MSLFLTAPSVTTWYWSGGHGVPYQSHKEASCLWETLITFDGLDDDYDDDDHHHHDYGYDDA